MSNKQQAEDFKNRGNKEYSNRNYAEAIKLYSKAIELDGTNAVYYSNRAAAYGGQANWSKSLEDGEQCIKLKKDWAKGYFRKGNALIELGKLEDGVAAFKEGLKHEPSNEELKKRLDEAEEQLRKNKPKVNPDGTPMTPAQLLKEQGNEFFKDHKPEQAIECYTKALNLCKETDTELKAALYNNRAACWVQLYGHNEIVKDCTEALKLQPNNVKALIRRGLAYEALERFEKGLEDMRAALLIDSSIPVANQAVHRISSALKRNQK